MRRSDTTNRGDLSPISPFTQFCLTSLPPIGTFSIRAEEEAMDIEKEEAKTDSSPPAPTPCGCQKTHCLKLYCECFANGRYCVGCNCHNCHNLPSYEPARADTIRQILERNPAAFRQDVASAHKVCHCKRSNCIKKYCECYEDSRPCTPLCKCEGCQNMGNK